MAIFRRKSKAIIFLILIVALLSLAFLHSLHKTTHSTINSKLAPNNQNDHIILTRALHKDKKLFSSLGGITGHPLTQTLRINLSRFTSHDHPSTKNPKIPSNTSVATKKLNCKLIRVVYLPGNWIEGSKNGYQSQDCDIPCEYTLDTRMSTLSSADAAVVHLPTNPESPETIFKKYKINSSKVLKVGMSMESTEAHPHQFDYLAEYDIEVTYRMSSDVPNPYFTFARRKQNLLEETNSSWESREKAVMFVARNCDSKSGRERLVRMLQHYIRVDSVSDCLHNKKWPLDVPRTDKRALLRRYTALLAAENSIEQDYVTEKVYAGLITGAVPVYYGAPNVDEFVPSNSIIKVPHPLTEEGVRQVAKKIQLVFDSKEEYEKLTSFKRHAEYEDRFLEKFNFTRIDVKCRLCQKIHSMKCV